MPLHLLSPQNRELHAELIGEDNLELIMGVLLRLQPGTRD